ncbi:MAG: hypothetical protein A2622_13535 [Bdellovibrionales bacterium RIFCSPHIGHO2_01_FULL_40_29]|nr:MAG: hypothetical protein A2622_13535 [Bdellovibrionales bacterium RIFCSPHIGHO2_01_FULL_40_29]OFZ34281.1 MAG: hypothetical protein A3D17_04415 [Bdellovibrionales bacterium RIFCSPHIGHO2_02_FULL_40_15]
MSEKFNGPPLASLTAAGIGSFSLGLFVVLTEAFPQAMKPLMTLDSGVGPLSGKTCYAVGIYFLSWIILYFCFKNKQLKEMFWIKVTFLFLFLALLTTFPPVFLLFGQHA